MLLFGGRGWSGGGCGGQPSQVGQRRPWPAGRNVVERGDVQILDIRDVRERQKLGFIPGSLHVPRGMLEFWLDPTSQYYTGKVDPEKRIVLHCAGGHRSALAADVLREMGFPNVAHLEPGFNGWAEAGMPVEGGEAKKG